MAQNLALLKKTRRRPVAGDVFVMKPPDRLYLFGRVIRTDVIAGGFPKAKLLYIYQARSEQKDKIPQLSPHALLVPPLMTNNLAWSRGYFEFVEHRDLRPEDCLHQHCFRDVLRGWFFDEKGRRLPGPVEPIDEWALHSFRTIDDEISKALGIPLSPD